MIKNLLFFGTLFLIPSYEALAYVPPAQFIIKSLVNKHAGFKGIRVKSKVTQWEGDKPGTFHFKTLTTFNQQTGLMRSWAMNDQDVKLYFVERRVEAPLAVDALLFVANPARAESTLMDRGIPIGDDKDGAGAESLDRLKSVATWVLGSDQTARLWIEKDTFLPLQMVFGSAKNQIQIGFDGFHFYHEFPYPHTIALGFPNGSFWLKDETVDVSVNLDLAKADSISAHEAPGFTDAGKALLSTQQELIQKYYEFIR